jgi:hypothetical protein
MGVTMACPHIGLRRGHNTNMCVHILGVPGPLDEDARMCVHIIRTEAKYTSRSDRHARLKKSLIITLINKI